MTQPIRPRARWNHNIHYGRALLDAVPPGARDALDVGCGEGWLARELSSVIDNVVGLDPDDESILAARTSSGDANGVEYVKGDLLTHPLEPSSFDFITCVAALHHMDELAALRRMADLLRPGGVLAVIGLARSRLPADLPWELAGAVATRAHKLTKTYWETPAPKIWPPPHSYRQIEQLSELALPTRTFRRRVLWRYELTWTKPKV